MTVVWPGITAITLVYLIGAYALLFGVALIGLAFRLRAWGRRWAEGAGPAAWPAAGTRATQGGARAAA